MMSAAAILVGRSVDDDGTARHVGPRDRHRERTPAAATGPGVCRCRRARRRAGPPRPQRRSVATVKQYAADNFDTAPAAWNGCQDPDHLAELPDSGIGNACISIDEAFSADPGADPEPGRARPTSRRSLGVDTVAVGASATAEAQLSRDDRIIPATVAASSGSPATDLHRERWRQRCALRQERRSSGNFGSFDAPRLNHVLADLAGQANDSLRINYSMGVDHLLVDLRHRRHEGLRLRHSRSRARARTTNVATGKDANHLLPFTGNVVPPLTDGVVDNQTDQHRRGQHLLFCGRLTPPGPDRSTTSPITDPEGCDCTGQNSPGPGSLDHRRRREDQWSSCRVLDEAGVRLDLLSGDQSLYHVCQHLVDLGCR